MNNEPNSGSSVTDFLESVGIDTKKVREPEDKPPAPYVMSTDKDKTGLPFEHPSYIKRSCKECYGRGWCSYLIGNGYKEGKRLQNRDLRTCVCVTKGYIKTKNEIELAIKLNTEQFKDEPEKLNEFIENLIYLVLNNDSELVLY